MTDPKLEAAAVVRAAARELLDALGYVTIRPLHDNDPGSEEREFDAETALRAALDEPAPLSPESRASLDRGIADAKAGRVSPLDLDSLAKSEPISTTGTFANLPPIIVSAGYPIPTGPEPKLVSDKPSPEPSESAEEVARVLVARYFPDDIDEGDVRALVRRDIAQALTDYRAAGVRERCKTCFPHDGWAKLTPGGSDD